MEYSEEESTDYSSDGYVFDYHRISNSQDDLLQSEPDIDFDLRRALEDSLSYDESQALHDTLHDQDDNGVIEPSQDNPNIVYSESLQQSRKFLSQVFNIPPSNFKRFHVPGLIILRLEDFALLRNDSRSSRIIPHILVNADLNALSNNPDFLTCIAQLGVK